MPAVVHQEKIVFPPGPRSWIPWLGEGLSLTKNPFGFFERLTDQFGGLVSFKVAGKKFILVSQPNLIQRVLSGNAANYRKGPVLENIREALGQGLLTAEGETWRTHRKLAQPGFHRSALQSYAQQITHCAREHFEQLDAAHSYSLLDSMMELTLKIAIQTLFGSRLRHSDETTTQLGRAFAEVTHYFEFALSPLGQAMGWAFRGRRSRYLRAVAHLDRFLEDLVKTRLEEIEATTGEIAAPTDVLGQLLISQLDEQKRVDYPALRDDLITFFIAGHETSAVALTFAILQIAQKPTLSASTEPTLAERLRAEIHAANTPGRDSHPLLYAVIKESLRLYPPVWAIGREAIAEDQLGQYRIPFGSLILIPTWSIHRSQAYYRDPLQFQPERWLESDPSKLEDRLPDGAYLPFGLGRRACIGEGFAWLELELVLTALLKQWEFTVTAPNPLRLTGTLTLRPRDPLTLNVAKRQSGTLL